MSANAVSWTLPLEHVEINIWLAEFNGWHIIKKEIDEQAKEVTIVAVRAIAPIEWPSNVHFGD